MRSHGHWRSVGRAPWSSIAGQPRGIRGRRALRGSWDLVRCRVPFKGAIIGFYNSKGLGV